MKGQRFTERIQKIAISEGCVVEEMIGRCGHLYLGQSLMALTNFVDPWTFLIECYCMPRSSN